MNRFAIGILHPNIDRAVAETDFFRLARGIQRPRGAGYESHQGWTCDKPGSVETGRSPLDSRAAAAIAGSGSRMGGTAW